MKKRGLFSFVLPFLAGIMGEKDDESVYKKLHSSKVRFSKYYMYHDPERDRREQCFYVHGEPVMAYSRKDAITRWIHRDLKNRKRR